VLVLASSPEQTKENRRLAHAAYDAEMGDLARRRFKLPSTQGRTFAAQAEWYLTHHTATHRGAFQERSRIVQLVAAFGEEDVAEITPTRWAEYRAARLEAGVSESTIGNDLTVAKLILASAVPAYLDVSGLATVKRKTVRVPEKRIIARADEPAFLKALLALNRELHDLYLVGVGTLLRQENLLELQRRAHLGDRLTLLTKTGAHTVPLTGPTPLQRRAAKVLRARLPKKPRDYFFPEWQAHFARFTYDRGSGRRYFLRLVRRAARDADIPWGLANGGIVWHTATRATGATRMIREYQVDVRTVQRIGGWASLDQMMAYLGVETTKSIT
jgi:integrase